MKHCIIIIVFLLTGTLIFAQEKKLLHNGNELYQQQKYDEAEASYRKSVDKNGKALKLEGNFNLGDALYKEKKYKDAAKQFSQLAESGNNKTVSASAYHNLGNSLLADKKYYESIEAYKKSLLKNPDDDQTRYNLAYAQDKLKQQQQQQKNNDKNKDKKDQDKQNQDKKDQDDKNKDKKDQDKKNHDKKNQDKKDQDKKDEQNDPNKVSKQDAERMLDALNNSEKQTQDKLKNKKLKGTKTNIAKDW